MLIYDIVPPKLKDTPKKRKVLKISFWALFIGVIFSFFLTIFLFLQSTQTTTASPDPIDPTLAIINVYSHPQAGDNWEVAFETTGIADLTITPDDQQSIDDLDFVSLKCLPAEEEGSEEERAPQILDNDVIFYPNWSCDGTAKVSHLVNVTGKHTLKFQFGDQIAYAYNSPDVETLRPNAATGAIPFDELMTAVDVAENKLLSGQYSDASFNKGELYFEVQGHWIRTSIIIGGIPADFEQPAQVERNKIRWTTSDISLEYRYLDIGLKESITLAKPMPIAFSYELNEGSYLESNPDGTISMRDESEIEILTIEKPFATDSKGKKFELEYKLSGNGIELAGDLSSAVYPITIDPTYTVETGTLADSTAYNGKRSLARKSNGDLWCTYSRSDGTTQQIYCAYSTDGGENWNEEQVTNQTAGNDQGYPSIAIDSSDNVHIVWQGLGWGTNTGYTNIQYRERTTSWQTQEAVTDEANVEISYPSIAIDSSDNIHVAWTGRGYLPEFTASNIQYRKRTIEGWQTQEAVTVEGIDQFCPSIAIDSADNIHVVWVEGSVLSVQYKKRTTSWQTQEAVTEEGYSYDDLSSSPSIAIDSADNIHVVWRAWNCGTNSDYFNIQYRERTTSWQTQEAITDIAAEQWDASIAIDSSDNIHVAWRGRGWGTNTTKYNIQYRERTTSWQTQVGITDRAYNNQYPILIWALYPTVSTVKTNIPKTGYALVWSGQDADGYKVEYFASDDLSWEVPNAAPTVSTLVSPSNGSYTSDNTPTLSANYSDPDAEDTGTTNYGIATSSANCLAGTVVASGTSSETSSNNENTTWTPSSSIGNDGTYYWCAQNNDGSLTSSWTAMGSFILDTSAPPPTPSGGGGMPVEWYNLPKPPISGFRILINSGANYTNNRKVALNLIGGLDTARMAISNFPDFRDAGQKTYVTTKEWDLCQGQTNCPDEKYTVYAKFYAPWGTASEVVSDTITLKTVEKPIVEMTIEEIKAKIVEIQQKIIELHKQLIQLIQEQISQLQAQLP